MEEGIIRRLAVDLLGGTVPVGAVAEGLVMMPLMTGLRLRLYEVVQTGAMVHMVVQWWGVQSKWACARRW